MSMGARVSGRERGRSRLFRDRVASRRLLRPSFGINRDGRRGGRGADEIGPREFGN